MWLAFCLLVLGWGVVASAAGAQPAVRVLETYPAGQSVTLASNQDFNLRLGYDSGQPVGIWITPYYRGEKVPAGTSPSARYSGTGEVLAWFFLDQPGQRVDEIRIRAGNGATNMPVVATYRVNVEQGSYQIDKSSPWAPTEPHWVSTMREQSKQQVEAQMQAAAAADTGSGGAAFLGVFMLGVAALGLAGLALPLVALRRWDGGWKLAALVPVAIVGFVIVRIAIDTAGDPTSHNLWPFEVLIAGLASLAVTGVLALARRLTAGARGVSGGRLS
jgi:hypothetical protein